MRMVQILSLVGMWFFCTWIGNVSANENDDLLRKMISVPEIDDVAISPDGKRVAYVREEPDWKQNWYDKEIFVVDENGQHQITNEKKGAAWNPQWRPVGDGIAFLVHRQGIVQIWICPDLDSRPVQLTAIDAGVLDFRWSPDGCKMAVLLNDRPDLAQQTREETYGRFHVADVDRVYRHLWMLDVGRVLATGEPCFERSAIDTDGGMLARITKGHEFTVGSFFNVGGFVFTPNGKELVFDHSAALTPEAIDTQDISVVDVENGTIRPLVRRPGYDANPAISADGLSIAFETSNGPYKYYGRDHLARVSLNGGDSELLTADFPESAVLVGWAADGIYFTASDRMNLVLYRMNAKTRELLRVTSQNIDVADADIDVAGRHISFVAESETMAMEVYLKENGNEAVCLTNLTKQFFDSTTQYDVRIVRYEGNNGVVNEGVLYLPNDWNENRNARSLLTIVHGGPKQTSRPQRVHNYVYPVDYWLKQGAAVFYPNYRGSAGYGDAYRSANVRDLGAGVMSDVLAGVQKLVDDGMADPTKLGLMGWSQGGYITAFTITRDKRFAAASVGAGISDWRTYRASSDDPEFTTHYLKASPSDDPAIYDAVSPMTAIDTVETPTLIQHGSEDARVPISNALELYRGLKNSAVETRLVTYRGLRHWISRPKERLAAVEHNRRWFDRLLSNKFLETDCTLTTNK